MKRLFILLVLLFVFSDCGESRNNNGNEQLAKSDKPKSTEAQEVENNEEDVYLELRNRILLVNPNDVGIEQNAEIPNVWGVLMEFWVTNGTVTLVSLADGTTSLYFSNGGGFIGVGENEEVANASREFINLTETYFNKMEPTSEFQLPGEGEIAFHVITFDEGFTINIDEEELTSGNHDFSPLYFMANDVISQVRIHTSNE